MPGFPGVTTTSAERREHLGQRVLPAAGAHDADPHQANCTYWSRPGPVPTKRTGTPTWFSTSSR